MIENVFIIAIKVNFVSFKEKNYKIQLQFSVFLLRTINTDQFY